jgi:hypothetical protein
VAATLTGAGPEGFTLAWPEGPRRGKLGSQFTTFVAPGLMWHDLTAQGFARFLTVVYATPIRPGECRLFARFPFRFESALPARLLRLRPQWLQHIGNHTVLEDDQVFLHWQERVLEQRGGSEAATRNCFLATSADRYVRALHDWQNRYAGEPFLGQRLPPRLSRDQLMDRYEAHTRHCRSCSGALRQLQRLNQIGLVLAGLGLALTAWMGASPAGAVGLLVAAAALGLRWPCSRWIRGLRRGRGLAPRNR